MQITGPGGTFSGTLPSGQFLAPDGTVTAAGYAFTSRPGAGLFQRALGQVGVSTGSTEAVEWNGIQTVVRSDAEFRWLPGAVYTGTPDAAVGRGAAGVVKLCGTGANPGGPSAPARTPAALAANANDYSPGAGWFQRWSASAPVNVTGMVAGVDGETRLVWNVGANAITLTNADALSAAANRFATSTGAALVLGTARCALAVYDTASTVWRVTLLP